MELNYQAIINALQMQANILIEKDSKFSDLVCYFVNEQAFNKVKLKSNEMLVVVRFGSASVLQGKIDLAIYFDIIGLPNEISRTQEFFTQYALSFNQQEYNETLQYWNTPSVSNRFNDYGYETRALLSMQGALVISLTNGVVDIAILNENTDEYESVRFLNEVLHSAFTPLPEATGDSNGRNITTNQANTITLSFSTYLTDFFFVKEALKYAFNKELDFNKRFFVRVNLANVYILEESFVITDVQIERKVAETSTMSVVLVV